MKPQPPSLSLKRGTPVYYYSGSRQQALYLGGKVGGYRVLSNSPTLLDSGMCVHTDEFPHAVFPAPNAQGVLDPSFCARIHVRLDSRLRLAVCYVQSGPEAWCASVSELVIGDHYRGSPVSVLHTHPTLDAALYSILPALLRELRELATGSDAQLQRRHSLPKSLYAKARRFGQTGILSIIGGIPRRIAGDILKSLNGAN